VSTNGRKDESKVLYARYLLEYVFLLFCSFSATFSSLICVSMDYSGSKIDFLPGLFEVGWMRSKTDRQVHLDGLCQVSPLTTPRMSVTLSSSTTG
jgi:hypothetical protein